MYHSEQKFIVDGDKEENLARVIDLAVFLSGWFPDRFCPKRTLKDMVYHFEGWEMVFRPFAPSQEEDAWTRCAPEFVASEEEVKQYCMLLINSFLKGPKAEEAYAMEPDIFGDGTSKKGWTVYVKTDSYKNHGELFRVKPTWTYYAK